MRFYASLTIEIDVQYPENKTELNHQQIAHQLNDLTKNERAILAEKFGKIALELLAGKEIKKKG